VEKIILRDSSNLEVVILPSYGAMIAEINMESINILKMNYSKLGAGKGLVGGIPVLFPFAGKTENDVYQYDGIEYSMPMHGFAKDMPFEIIYQDIQKCSLRLKSNEITYKRYYPFNFDFIISYELKDGELTTTMHLENQSETDMPVNIGFHPYFKTVNKEATLLIFDFKDYLNYYDGNGARGVLEGKVDLSKPYDHVFFGDAPQQMTLFNKDEGYSVNITTDDTFNVVTIYTNSPYASCIEPWQSLPNNIITKEAVKFVPARSLKTFWYKIRINMNSVNNNLLME
jgi:galactose mutarotase-like enzyme